MKIFQLRMVTHVILIPVKMVVVARIKFSITRVRAQIDSREEIVPVCCCINISFVSLEYCME